MELPGALRMAVDRALEGVALADLSAAAARLSQRYRAELRDGRFHVDGDLAVRAYLATRLPATYAAIRACLDAVADLRPDFTPARLLDAGAGPGTGFWAAAEAWPDLAGATLLEGSAAFRDWGARLADGTALPPADWRAADLARRCRICRRMTSSSCPMCWTSWRPTVAPPWSTGCGRPPATCCCWSNPAPPPAGAASSTLGSSCSRPVAMSWRRARTTAPARWSSPTGATSPSASPAPASTARPRAARCRGRMRNLPMSRCRATRGPKRIAMLAPISWRTPPRHYGPGSW
jgi:hypothetical protein